MAYAALNSLHQTIKRLMFSDRIELMNDSSTEIIEFLEEQVASAQQLVGKLKRSININRKRINVLDVQIREAAHEFEDALEFHVSDQLLSSNSHHIFVNLEELKQVVDSFTQNLNEMKDAYNHELCSLPPKEEDADVIPSKGGNESEMVGLSDQFDSIRDRLIFGVSMVISLFGMAGIGKTTLAKKLFEDPSMSTRCSKRAFVTVGPVYRLEHVLLDILKQVINNPNDDDDDDDDDDENNMLFLKVQEPSLDCLRAMIHQCLKDRTFLVVLDDVWDKRLWSNLVASFPMDRKKTNVLITTRVRRVAESTSHDVFGVRLLNKKESWDLLRKKVFDEEESFSYELEKAGKKIAERCEGLSLTIVTVAHILSDVDIEKTAKFWNEVAANKRHPVFVDAYDQMYEVLYPSYNYLNQELKACFLYMGVFPQTYEIPFSKLKDLWTVEGLCPKNGSNLTLNKLDSSSLVMVHKIRFDRAIKICSLYSPFWHLSNKEAKKNKFFHGMSICDDVAEDDLKSQRRLCIHNNVLFGIKDLHDMMASISTVRSLLCTGLYHQYPVPICFGSNLLKIIEALTVRFYEFPLEVVNIVRMTYLSLTFSGNIPSSIAALWNLRYLIVRPHLSIVKSDGTCSYLPMEIWKMKSLNHLQVMGSNLPQPRKNSVLKKLSTLLAASPQSCTKYIFKRIPNLEKLGIRIELSPDTANQVALSCFDHITRLNKLRILKCLVANPRIIPAKVVVAPLSILPSSLEKLTFSGSFGYPWEEMTKISSLPKLRELKVRCYAFCGPEWKVERGGFPKLRYLLIEDTDLVRWTFENGNCFKKLKSVSIKHCYKLEEIPMELGANRKLETIELVDCNPTALACANKLKVDPQEHFMAHLNKTKEEREMNSFSLPLAVNIHSSWDTDA